MTLYSRTASRCSHSPPRPRSSLIVKSLDPEKPLYIFEQYACIQIALWRSAEEKCVLSTMVHPLLTKQIMAR